MCLVDLIFELSTLNSVGKLLKILALSNNWNVNCLLVVATMIDVWVLISSYCWQCHYIVQYLLVNMAT